MLDFAGKRWWYLSVSLVFFTVAVASLAIFHLRPGIEFTSGSTFTIEFTEQNVTQGELRTAFGELGHPEARVQGAGTNKFLIRTSELKNAPALDANILIFERMKEELRRGRTLNAAIDIGFRRAWTSIRDSNVSTLITCVVLYYFGNQFGAAVVQGFAFTLAIGVLVSMFSAITVTRTFLKMILGTPLAKSHFLFNAEEQKRVVPVRRRASATEEQGNA